MKITPPRRLTAVLTSLALLIGAGAIVSLVLTPAGATLQDQVSSAAQNWNKIWKQKIRPRSDKRYFTKARSNKRFHTKKAANQRFARKPAVIRGAFTTNTFASGAGNYLLGDVSFGVQLAAAPVPHYIPSGAPLPAGCRGNAAEPDADPGHLCVFETLAVNVTNQRIYSATPVIADAASRTGAWIVVQSTAAGNAYAGGTWAVRVDPSAAPATAPAGEGLKRLP